MKQLNHKLATIILLIAIIVTYNAQAQVKIGDNPSTSDANTLLELESTTKSLLLPRMTSTQRDEMVSPTSGIEIYNSTTDMFNYYNGSSWKPLNNKAYLVSKQETFQQLKIRYYENTSKDKWRMENHKW